MKNYLYVGLVSLLLLPLAGCPGKEDNSSLNPNDDDHIVLENLNKETTSKRWKKFFVQRGAKTIWQQLKKVRNEEDQEKTIKLKFKLSILISPTTKNGIQPEEKDEVAAGIIKYLAWHEWKGNILDLSQNGLTKISPEVGKLPSLKFLDLKDNNLTELPREIGNLSNLTDLYLENNQLTSIPTEIGNLSNLESLNLSNNQLIEIPREIGKLSKLNFFVLSNNKLTEIPKEIGNISPPDGFFLDLSYNSLSQLPASILNLNLRGLSLAFNPWITPQSPKLEAIIFNNEKDVEKFTTNYFNQKIHATSLLIRLFWYIQNNLNKVGEKRLEDIPVELKEQMQNLSELGYKIFEDVVFFRTWDNENIPFVLNDRVANSDDLEKLINKILEFHKAGAKFYQITETQ